MNLIRVMLEHFQELFLGHDKTFKGLLLFGNLIDYFFEIRIIILADNTVYLVSLLIIHTF